MTSANTIIWINIYGTHSTWVRSNNKKKKTTTKYTNKTNNQTSFHIHRYYGTLSHTHTPTHRNFILTIYIPLPFPFIVWLFGYGWVWSWMPGNWWKYNVYKWQVANEREMMKAEWEKECTHTKMGRFVKTLKGRLDLRVVENCSHPHSHIRQQNCTT